MLEWHYFLNKNRLRLLSFCFCQQKYVISLIEREYIITSTLAWLHNNYKWLSFSFIICCSLLNTCLRLTDHHKALYVYVLFCFICFVFLLWKKDSNFVVFFIRSSDPASITYIHVDRLELWPRWWRQRRNKEKELCENLLDLTSFPSFVT